MGALVPSRPLLPDLDAAAPPASAILSPASATRPNSERRLQGRLSSRADLELDRATRRRAARIPQDPQGQHREWEEATLPKIAGTAWPRPRSTAEPPVVWSAARCRLARPSARSSTDRASDYGSEG